MKAIPAIDLREGACVQLVGGSYDDERVRLPDPLNVAEQWRAAGFSTFHVVDLDAATGRGSNASVIEQLIKGGDVQVGGGVRDEATIERWLGLGAARVVVGTRGVEDQAWLVGGAASGRTRPLPQLPATLRDRTNGRGHWRRRPPGSHRRWSPAHAAENHRRRADRRGRTWPGTGRSPPSLRGQRVRADRTVAVDRRA
jgi:phosphoribosylformimino-5-aminoimidazole carboxamide ribotide isomerase